MSCRGVAAESAHRQRPNDPIPYAVLLVALIALLDGCAYVATTKLDYAPIPVAAAEPPPHPTLLVVPLRDDRPPKYYPSEMGRMFLTYIPLLPYVTIPYERLDESLLIATEERGGSFPRDQLFPRKMAAVIADDLRSSQLFSKVELGDPGSHSADYVLTGRLRSTEFDVNATSYMLGIAGVLLWLVPIPIGSQTADVAIDLALQDASGNTVWQFPLQGTGRRVYTLYNSGGAPVSNRMALEIKRYGTNDQGIDGDSLWAYHAAALRTGMGEAKASLAAYLRSAPQPPPHAMPPGP
jgi:hypothetical protein